LKTDLGVLIEANPEGLSIENFGKTDAKSRSNFSLNKARDLCDCCCHNKMWKAKLMDKLGFKYKSDSEMKYLRKVTGKTRRDQIMNTAIRNQLKQESVEVLMEKRTLRWYGHAERMDLERRPKLVLKARAEGRRGRGRPRLQLEEYVERLACKSGRKLPEVKRLAQDRK
jgi:hypothetical protein